MPDATPSPLPPDTSRFDAALKRANQYRHIAEQFRRRADEYDTMAEKVMSAMKDKGHG